MICGAHGNPKPSFCGDSPPPPTGPPGPSPPSPSPPSPSPPGCVNDPLNWHDSDGDFYDCEWYGEGDNCAVLGDGFEHFGKTANEACCVCGGGSSTGPAPGPSPPSPGPGPSPCPAGEKLFEVEVRSDYYGSDDNKFRVQKKSGGTFTNFWTENITENDSTQNFQQCLDASKCYKFIMIDRNGDGLCCESGDGGYKITWGGKGPILLID